MSIQVSRSAFRRVGDTINMKPGVDVLKVGTVDVTGITLDTNYAIDISSHLPVFKDNRTGEDTTKNFILDADIFDSGTTTLKCLTCIDSYYFDNSKPEKCQKCHPLCATCSNGNKNKDCLKCAGNKRNT